MRDLVFYVSSAPDSRYLSPDSVLTAMTIINHTAKLLDSGTKIQGIGNTDSEGYPEARRLIVQQAGNPKYADIACCCLYMLFNKHFGINLYFVKSS